MRLALLSSIALVAAPAFAQAAAVDATGPIAGRSPHRAIRTAAATPSCKAVTLPGGKLPTYGNPAVDPRCRAAELYARSDDRDAAARD